MEDGNPTYVLVGLAGVVVTGLAVLGARYFLVSEHPVRAWLNKNIDRDGFFQFSRFVGLVVLMAVFAVLTLVYS